MNKTVDGPLDRIRSHTVFVCPGFECNARMSRDALTMTYTCVNGHSWTDEQIHWNDLRKPWRTGWRPHG